MKSESKKFEPKVEQKPFRKWLISFERWQYVQVNVCVEKRSVKIEDITLESALDQLKANYDLSVKDDAKKLFIVNVIEL